MSSRKISAKKLVGDIKSKVAYGHLLDRYSLSATELDSLFQKLVDTGRLSKEELPDKIHVSQAGHCLSCRY